MNGIQGADASATTVVEERGGHIIKQFQRRLPDQKPINRTFINVTHLDELE